MCDISNLTYLEKELRGCFNLEKIFAFEKKVFCGIKMLVVRLFQCDNAADLFSLLCLQLDTVSRSGRVFFALFLFTAEKFLNAKHLSYYSNPTRKNYNGLLDDNVNSCTLSIKSIFTTNCNYVTFIIRILF